MAAIKSISAQELSNARKSGFKGRKPKKPRAGASLNALESYVTRYNSWVDRARAAVSKKRDKVNSEKKRQDLRKRIAKL